MHVIFREAHGLDELDTPYDLKQDPAELVVLSFSDSDLGAFAAGWRRSGGKLPSLRLANLVALKHPLSVDTYIEKTLTGAKAILIRLIGGESYWSYGLAQVQFLARQRGIALAVLPVDGQEDPSLEAYSTLPRSTLRQLQALCDAGGAIAAEAALAQLALSAGLYAGPVMGQKTVPDFGIYHPLKGIVPQIPFSGKPLAIVSFYRSYLTAADTEPIDAHITHLEAQGYTAYGIFAPSLKDPEAAAWIAGTLQHAEPAIIINATAFSARRSEGGASPLDAPGCPVMQIALSTAQKSDWSASERGLSPTDLAMHVVLPEVDGRIFAGVCSFKAPERRDPDLQYSRFAHRAEPERIAAITRKAMALANLAARPAAEKKLAVVLSTYPGKSYNIAHAVGLDPLQSLEAMLPLLAKVGYRTGEAGNFDIRSLSEARASWPLASYELAMASLPETLRQDLKAAWGQAVDDPAVENEQIRFPAFWHGNILIALQPERDEVRVRDDAYHDLARTPRHAYVAFYLWLQEQGLDALIHMGAHGTLEWLPGKSVALSNGCWPEALIGAVPVIYPFIVNDPGEAAQAKRRIGAVTLGHMPPPLEQAATPESLTQLESLLDEYSTADGLHPTRRDRLISLIRDEAQARGVEADLGLEKDASPAESITRIDRFVCDLKESRFGDGLHVFGTGDYGQAENRALLAALAGQRIDAGPSGSPYRGRSDVIPTGRNLYTTDPRAVPTRVAYAQGVKMAEEMLRRHLQDQGEYPGQVFVDLWGSATMRTAGEEFAMALHLAGIKPLWDEGSDRVSGFEVIPLTLLNRPRIDVTLRISGLFRDVFANLAQLFEGALASLAERGEAEEDNPYCADQRARVFGPKPGSYGLALGDTLETYSEDARHAAGEAWLSASAWTLGADGTSSYDRDTLEKRVRQAAAFVHVQDLPETDLLLAEDYAAHEAGFAAARSALQAESLPTYHLDATNPADPRARLLPEEIARVVRARAANPAWVNGMMAHGFRGAAEMAATLDHMAAFAHLAKAVPGHLFDLYYDATLGRAEVADFIAAANPEALTAMQARFRALLEAGVWQSRLNSVLAC